MPPSRAKVNRGPAAAAENRSALLTAARKVFAERGYRAPLSAIARQAGVGQGVLYRHFPTRLQLALAVFDQDWAQYQALSEDPDPHAFATLWSLLVDKTIEEAAFIEMALDARQSLSEYDGYDHMRSLLEPPLARAQAAGLIDPSVTGDDVMLAQRMVYGIVITATVETDVREAIRRALRVVGLLPDPL